ncbi:MAG: arsenite efflux transporter metallochaperone ArsD [Planctomycetota bacterium]|jgi:arsenite methyltransferase|nr:arsenite efflux transporter metallochaperone ArsD [Blastopirellula sp.]
MALVQVFDPPMCCSTGVCGPEVDSALPQFAADLERLRAVGHKVQRFNLAQQPLEFVQNQTIHKLISTAGTNCLPVVLIEGKLVAQGTYPSLQELTAWIGEPITAALPLSSGGGCCGNQGCC